MASTLLLFRHHAGCGRAVLERLGARHGLSAGGAEPVRVVLETGEHPSAAGRHAGAQPVVIAAASLISVIASLRICGDTCACAEAATGSAADTEAKPASARAGIEETENLGMVVS